MPIPKSVLTYLQELSKNNNREWFTDHKSQYQEQHEHLVLFAEELLQKMTAIDEIETPSAKKSLMRIYRDTRFSKDKTPYKTHMGGGLKRATRWKRGGYYYHIEPGKSFVGCGFWGPNPDDLKHIRSQIAADPTPLRSILNSKQFIQTFGQLQGEQVKTAPKGYAKDHPAIDLLRYKQFLVAREFTDKEVLSKEFVNQVTETFKAVRPFFDYMSEILTTDLNGEPLA